MVQKKRRGESKREVKSTVKLGYLSPDWQSPMCQNRPVKKVIKADKVFCINTVSTLYSRIRFHPARVETKRFLDRKLLFENTAM